MATELLEGMKAPDFTLPDHTGSAFTLSQARGKPVVLFFYSENDTQICTTHACNMQQVHAELASLGVSVSNLGLAAGLTLFTGAVIVLGALIEHLGWFGDGRSLDAIRVVGIALVIGGTWLVVRG